MAPYVEFLIHYLEEQGYECKMDEETDGDVAKIWFFYEIEDENTIVVLIICYNDMVILRTIAERDIGISHGAFEYTNTLNLRYLKYRLMLDTDDGDLFIEHISAIKEWLPDFITVPNIFIEIERLCECCVEIRNELYGEENE